MFSYIWFPIFLPRNFSEDTPKDQEGKYTIAVSDDVPGNLEIKAVMKIYAQFYSHGIPTNGGSLWTWERKQKSEDFSKLICFRPVVLKY